VGTNRKSIIDLAAASHIPAPPDSLELPFYYVASAFDFPFLLVLRHNGEWDLARWGLVPFWTKTLEQATNIRRQTVNARSESMWQKPAFKEAANGGRCLIPVDGFFEFHHHGGKAYPFYIHLEGHSGFLSGGIAADLAESRISRSGGYLFDSHYQRQYVYDGDSQQTPPAIRTPHAGDRAR